MQQTKLIPADSNAFDYMGRIDFSDSSAPIMYYAGSLCSIGFSGTSVSARIINHRFGPPTYIGFVIDGEPHKLYIEGDSEQSVLLCDGLEDKLHTLTIFKAQDAYHSLTFLGIEIDHSASVYPIRFSSRRIEAFGDSVSAGAVCEAEDYVGICDPPEHDGKYDNAWYSFTMQTARLLDARINNNAQGGIALFDGTGYFGVGADTAGLESIYDKLAYTDCYGITQWDFTRYIPQLVIIAIGQNDNHRNDAPDNDIDDPDYRNRWKSRYKSIILSLRGHYPNASFVLCTTLLKHYSGWDDAIDEAANELNDAKVHHFRFKRNGIATDGHPRISEDAEMASELAAYIESLGDIWSE